MTHCQVVSVETKLTCLLAFLQSLFIQLPRKDEVFIGSYPLDQLPHPFPFLVIPNAIRPPLIHTPGQRRAVQPVVFTLLIEYMQDKSCVQTFKPKLGETFEDT